MDWFLYDRDLRHERVIVLTSELNFSKTKNQGLNQKRPAENTENLWETASVKQHVRDSCFSIEAGLKLYLNRTQSDVFLALLTF